MNDRAVSRLVCVLSVVGVGAMLAFSGQPGQPNPPENPPNSEMLGVPVGTVILWWGEEKNIPANFEVCDGQNPRTPGAMLGVQKPEMRGRFPVGVLNENRFRPWQDNFEEVMSHVHSIEHTHEIDSHSHATDPHAHDMKHTHSIAPHAHETDAHTHSLSTHTHTIDAEEITLTVLTPGDEGDPPVETEITYLAPGGGTVESSGPAPDQTESTDVTVDPSSPTDSGASSRADTGSFNATVDPSGTQETGDPDPSQSGIPDPVKAGRHNNLRDDGPAGFVQFIFIIRVK